MLSKYHVFLNSKLDNLTKTLWGQLRPLRVVSSHLRTPKYIFLDMILNSKYIQLLRWALHTKSRLHSKLIFQCWTHPFPISPSPNLLSPVFPSSDNSVNIPQIPKPEILPNTEILDSFFPRLFLQMVSSKTPHNHWRQALLYGHLSKI